MSIERQIESLVATVFEDQDSRVWRSIEEAGFDPQVEGQRLRAMLARCVDSFGKFYSARIIDADELLSVADVAKRYNKDANWVHHCPQLQAIHRKVGKFKKYRVEDLEALEKKQHERRRGFALIRRDTETASNRQEKVLMGIE